MANEELEKHTLSVLVENQPGVLARIAGMFSGRGFNISSLSVGETADPAVSRMTIVVEGGSRTLEQIIKQLRKLIVTVKVEHFGDEDYVHSELLVLKVNSSREERSEIQDLASVFNGKVVDISHDSMTIRFVGKVDKIEDVIQLLRPYGVKEMARTGSVALRRAPKST